MDSVGEDGFGVARVVADGRPSDDRFWFVFGDDPALETLVVSEEEDVERSCASRRSCPSTRASP